MAVKVLAPQKRPCGTCPYRQDTPSGVWVAEEYEKLPPYDAETGDQPAGVFLCHQQDGHVCAGWAGCHDMENSMALRLAVSFGVMDPEEMSKTVEYVSPVPLWSSGREAAEYGLRDVAAPSTQAVKKVANLRRKLGGDV